MRDIGNQIHFLAQVGMGIDRMIVKASVPYK